MAIDERKVLEYSASGLKSTEIAEKLSTEEEKVTHQAVTAIVKKNAVTAELVVEKTGVQTMTASEYMTYSKANGRSPMGGEMEKPQNVTIEDLRAKINSNWTPSMCLENWQLTEHQLLLLVRKLSKAELRDKEIKTNFKQDFFR